MLNSFSKHQKIIFYLFSIIMSVFYITFIILEYSKPHLDNTFFKYATVVFSGLYVLYQFINSLLKKERIIILSFSLIAIIFTLISDYFLLILDKYYEIGLTTFIIAQILYGVRIHFEYTDKEILLTSISIRIISLIASLIYLLVQKDLLTSLVIFYSVNHIFNFISSLWIFIKHKDRHMLILAIGFFLFILCDICVGIYNLKEISFIIPLMWIFYTPSQYFLSLSTALIVNKQE